MPDRTNDDLLGIANVKQCHLPVPPNENDEITHESAVTHLSAAEWTVSQQLAGSLNGLNGLNGTRRDVQVASWAGSAHVPASDQTNSPSL